MHFTGKQRLSIAVALAWVTFVAFEIEPWSPRGVWSAFLLFGVAPPAIVAAIAWVRAGFVNDRRDLK